MTRSLKPKVKLLIGLVSIVCALLLYKVARVPNDESATLTIPIAAYAPGSVRLDHGVWVARQLDGEFYAFLDHDPHRGQRLTWVESKGLFMQAASYRIDGSCEMGPCVSEPGQGLYRVKSQVEGSELIVHTNKIISGGLDPEPGWLTNLKYILRTFR